MHETVVAQSIFETILAQSREYDAKPISAKVSCGQLNPINDEVLGFAFEAISKGTVCEGMKLEIIHIPLRAACKSCKNTFEFDIYSPKCAKCDSKEFDFQEDAPLLLEEIELEDKDEDKS